MSVFDRLWFSSKSFKALQVFSEFSVSSDDIWSNCTDTRLGQFLVESLLLSKLMVYIFLADSGFVRKSHDTKSSIMSFVQISQHKILFLSILPSRINFQESRSLIIRMTAELSEVASPLSQHNYIVIYEAFSHSTELVHIILRLSR